MACKAQDTEREDLRGLVREVLGPIRKKVTEAKVNSGNTLQRQKMGPST